MLTIDPGSLASRRSPRRVRAAVALVGAAALAAATTPVQAQAVPLGRGAADTALDALVREAVAHSPMLRAADDRATASRARILPAGTRPDPTLMAGLVQVPVRHPSLTDDNFTMLMVGVTQSLPAAGKRAARTRVAERDATVADAVRDGIRVTLMHDVKAAWYELAYLDRAIEIAERAQQVLAAVVRVTEMRYGDGAGTQQDVLKARLESARLAETASGLVEGRVAARARFNALLDRPADAPVTSPAVPPRLARAAVEEDASRVRFVSQAFGARAAGSPLPPLETLQALALAHSPGVREGEARVAAQAARVELSRSEARPDVDLMLQYNHRVAYPDLLTAQVSFPLHLNRAAKQGQAIAETAAELSSAQAEHRAAVAALQARVAAAASDVERRRTQLALYTRAVLPQARAAVGSALATYQSGRTDLLTLLDLESTVFTAETSYARAMSDFATSVAELEQVVGVEVLP